MRMFILLFTTMFLHGCASDYVIKKAQGYYNFFPSDLKHAYFDDKQKEFVLCIIDSSDSMQEDSSRFTVKIPQDIIAKGGNNRFMLTSGVVEAEVKRPCWLRVEGCTDYLPRKDIRLYRLSGGFRETNAEGRCNDALKNSLEDMEILRVPNDISFDEAMLFKGETINGMLAKKQPFLIYVPDSLIAKKRFDFDFHWGLSPCPLLYHSCFIFVIKPKSGAVYLEYTGEQTIPFSEILTIGELTRAVQPKPAWYMAMPLSIALDAVVIPIYIMGGGPR
jgi:hypothetical protein